MLSVHFHNVSDVENVSNYNVYVDVNGKLIYKGKVNGHKRIEGWEALVKKFAKAL